MRHTAVILAAVAAAAATSSAYASTFTLTGSELASVGLSVPATTVGDTGSATYASGQITLTSGNNVPGFFDTAQITIDNGFDGASFGTLNQLFTSGLSFDLVSMSPGNPGLYAYFNVIISNGTNTYQLNSYGDNVLGANVFDTGQGTGVSASPQLGNLFQDWSTFAGSGPGSYGTYNVTEISIDVGGWCASNGSNCGPQAGQTAVIDSITLPGTFTGSSDASVPEPASLAVLGAGLAGLGFVRRRRKV